MADFDSVYQFTVHSGKNLRKADIFGKGDPYVVIKVNRVKIHTTVVKYGTDSPRFEESVHVGILSGNLL